MPNLFTVPAHAPIARIAAQHLLATLTRDALSETLIIVPNRRSCAIMRKAFEVELQGASALLPRIIALADSEDLLIEVLRGDAFTVLANTPRAFTDTQHRYVLAQQVAAYERKCIGRSTMQFVLTMADALMQLQESCARAEITLTQAQLRALYHTDFADHWREALLFLGILTEHWPAMEQAYGLTIAAQREMRLLDALRDHWQETPAKMPVVAIGSTASQPATARLLKTIADMEMGQVILPGLDSEMDEMHWQSISAGHPLNHLKAFLAHWPIAPAQVRSLALGQPNLWLEALAPSAISMDWASRPLPAHHAVQILPCAHGEEEARVICLLVREALEAPNAHVALITPDEGLMAKVAAHLNYYGIAVDRVSVGSLATTQTGSLWVALLNAMVQPSRQLGLRELLHHPLLAIPEALLDGLERGWYGLNRGRAGQLPRHEAALSEHTHYAQLSAWVAQIASYTMSELRASDWVAICKGLIDAWQTGQGQGADAVAEQCAALSDADDFGPMAIEDFAALMQERLSEKWRDAGLQTHPRIHFLTPIEARLQTFDRVILGAMQDLTWHGASTINPWLNQAAYQALGLPMAEEQLSLIAHDVLMLASQGEVFFTYPLRDGGSPVARSRFLEKLLALLAAHGVKESSIMRYDFQAWAERRYASAHFTPEREIYPRPAQAARPHRLAVTSMDTLFTDPFSIYARYVLRLKPLDAMDAEPEASDFGSLAHRALEQLTAHWNETATAASEADLTNIAHKVLLSLSERPNIDLFWRARLINGLRYINRLEAMRRIAPIQVGIEREMVGTITTPHGTITLEGRIDRIEPSSNGAVIIDYKTGDIPSQKAVLEGRKLQMLAYAMLLEGQGESVFAFEYWQLPKLGEEGKTLPVALGDVPSDLPEKLRIALADMLDPETPFLARPISTSNDERYCNDYDGISRYDEWAG